jgi:hypothetical protein
MAQRIIIFDGPDMTGKTAIARELSHRAGIPYFKASSEHATFLGDCGGSRQSGDIPEFLNQLWYADPRTFDLLKQTGQSIIFDRAYPSEYVYSALFHRQTDMQAIQNLDQLYRSLGANLVLCVRASYAGIRDDLKPDMGPEVLRRQHDLYMDFLRATRLDSVLLHTDDEDLEREIHEVREALVI